MWFTVKPGNFQCELIWDVKGMHTCLKLLCFFCSLQVDVDSTVGLDAFSRLMPAIPTVADAITVQGQFEALTTSTGGRLPFPLYDKYLGELDK
jgi:hypothetical protein